MQGILITNNPAAYEKFLRRCETVYLEGGKYMDVLIRVRDMIHTGHRLLSHPLSGSVKPGQTPYKSIMMTKEKGGLDAESLAIMEAGIAVAGKQADMTNKALYTEEILKDFQFIDLELISD